MNNKIDVIIVGGGMSGLLAAICLKDKQKDCKVTVIEQNSYPLKKYQSILLPPISRQLLRDIGLYKQFQFNEGRYLVFNIINEEYFIDFVVEDVATMQV